jgi:hypothetical protein
VMTFLRRFRAPAIGLVALAFSAGVALAAAPSSPGATGLATAATHAGKTVPVQATDQSGEQTEATDTEDTTDSGDTSSSDHCSVDLTQAASVLAGLNHGSVVCTAAQGSPAGGYSPTTFGNHGAWVSSFATGGHGASQSATGRSHKPS